MESVLSPEDIIARTIAFVNERRLTSGEAIEDLEGYRDLIVLACNKAIEELREEDAVVVN
jgi:hypothetical protein